MQAWPQHWQPLKDLLQPPLQPLCQQSTPSSNKCASPTTKMTNETATLMLDNSAQDLSPRKTARLSSANLLRRATPPPQVDNKKSVSVLVVGPLGDFVSQP